MKYPKLWNGTSPLGEALVRSLQRVRSPFLSAKAGDVHANKMGGRSEVFQGDDIGLLSAGATASDGLSKPYRIAAAIQPRRPFTTAGVLDRFSAVGNLRLGYLGDGKAYTFVRSGTEVPDTSRTIAVTTKRGRLFSSVLEVAHSTARVSAGVPGALTGMPLQWTYGFSGTRIVSPDEVRPVYWRKTEDGLVAVDIPVVQDFTGGAFLRDITPVWMHRVGPTSILGLVPVEPPIDIASPEPLYHLSRLALSNDNGVSWSMLPPGALISEMEPTPSSPGIDFALELREFAAGLVILAMSNGQWLIAGVTRLYSPGGSISGRGRALVLFRVTESGSVMELSVPTTADAGLHGFVLGDEPVLQLGFGPGETGTLLRFAPDLADVAVLDLPWVGSRHGTVLPLSPTELMVPAYDGDAYRLFLSGNGGATWTPGGTIDRKAPPPTTTERVMRRYSRVELVRRNGRAAPTFPGQPWVGDSRITPPWEA